MFVEEHMAEQPLKLNVQEYLVMSGKKGYGHMSLLFQHQKSVQTTAEHGERPMHHDSTLEELVVERPYRSSSPS